MTVANQKLVDACLRAPRPDETISAPPREVAAAAKAFAKFDEAQRLAVIPHLVRWLGLDHDWPELSADEVRAFTDAAREARPSYFLPIAVALLFGAYDWKIPRTATSLEAFNRGLAILKTKRLWESDRLFRKAPEALPTFPDEGPENERIVACFLEVETPEQRAVLIAFLLKNERWSVFDTLEAGFAKGRGELKAGDTLYAGQFPQQQEAFAAILSRLQAAMVKGREVLKPIWDAEGVVSAQARTLFDRSPEMKKRFGKAVWWVGMPRSKSTSPDDISMSVGLSRKVGELFERLGTFSFSAQRKGQGPWKFSKLEVETEGETICF